MSELINQENNIQKYEFDVQIETAKKYPRNLKKSVEDMRFMATIDQDTAESCFYVLKRKDKDIIGPSIRMAEIAISCWQNIHVATRITENDGSFVTAQACCWDLERNVKIITEVKRSIKYSNGGTYTQDMQVITANAASAIALRNAAFKVIPKAYVDAVYKECRKASLGDVNLFAKKRKDVVDRLIGLGVNENDMLLFLGKKSVDDLIEDDVADLIGVGVSIREGLVKANEAFLLTGEMKEISVSERIKMITGGKK